jgi:hypothetical protein
MHMKRITRPGLTGIPAQLQLDRHFAGERLNVFARSVLGGLHHEYSLAPGERDGSADAVSTEGKCGTSISLATGTRWSEPSPQNSRKRFADKEGEWSKIYNPMILLAFLHYF